MNSRFKVLTIIAVLVLLAGIVLTSVPASAQISVNNHVYYGYVPPSTSIAGVETDFPRQVDEIIKGTETNYTVPSGTAILDVVGLKDGTSFELWDVYANQKMDSITINRFERKCFFIAVGTFFKVVASTRVAVLLTGGQYVYEPQDSDAGTSTFYPAVTGGFRGKEFIFNAAPPTHPYAYSIDRIGYNFYLMALEGTDWSLTDSIDVWSTSGHLSQRDTKTTILQSRKNHLEYHNGVGDDVVFHVTTSSDVEVSCCALDDFVAVPAITGGYVGKLFYAPEAVTVEEPGRTAAFIVIPLEEGKVTVYDKNLNVIAEKSFTGEDVTNKNYWYYNLGIGRFNLIAESTGNICFTVGNTQGTADISHLGDDITYIGSRPGQEIRFYAPTMAVVFATETLTATIDGGAPVQMAEDAFRLLESGVHSISADKHVIVEVLAAGSAWYDWGSYLIEPLDTDVSFEAPAGFTSKPVDFTMYMAGAAVAAIVVVLAVFIIRRRRVERF